VGWDNLVSIATRYGLDGPGIKSQWGRDLLHLSRPALGAQPASHTTGTGPILEVKQPGCDVDYPPSSSAEAKETVQLNIYCPSGPSWPVLG